MAQVPPGHKSVPSVLSVKSVVKKEPILRRTAFQAAESSVGLSWHTSSVGVPGYSKYCPPGSGVLCAASCPVRMGFRGLPHARQMVYFVFVLLPVRGFKGSRVQRFNGSRGSAPSYPSYPLNPWSKKKSYPWWNRLELLWILDGT